MISRRNLLFWGAAGPAMANVPAFARTNQPLLSAHWRSQVVQGDPPGGRGN